MLYFPLLLRGGWRRRRGGCKTYHWGSLRRFYWSLSLGEWLADVRLVGNLPLFPPRSHRHIVHCSSLPLKLSKIMPYWDPQLWIATWFVLQVKMPRLSLWLSNAFLLEILGIRLLALSASPNQSGPLVIALLLGKPEVMWCHLCPTPDPTTNTFWELYRSQTRVSSKLRKLLTNWPKTFFHKLFKLLCFTSFQSLAMFLMASRVLYSLQKFLRLKHSWFSLLSNARAILLLR